MNTKESTKESVNIEISEEVTFTTAQVWRMFTTGGLLASVLSPLFTTFFLSNVIDQSTQVTLVVLQYAVVFFVVASFCGVGLLYVGYRPSRHNREGKEAHIEQTRLTRRIPFYRRGNKDYIDIE